MTSVPEARIPLCSHSFVTHGVRVGMSAAVSSECAVGTYASSK